MEKCTKNMIHGDESLIGYRNRCSCTRCQPTPRSILISSFGLIEQESKKPKVDVDEFKGYQGLLFESPCGRKMICTFVTSHIISGDIIIKCINLKNFEEYTYDEQTVKELTRLPSDPNITVLSVLADKTRFERAKLYIIQIAKIDAQIEEHRKTIQEVEAKIKELERHRKEWST